MTARLVPRDRDPIERRQGETVRLSLDGTELLGERGQTIAGVLMAHGISSWRTTSVEERPRGLFCGIGVCFDCILTVNDERDVRACQRRAQDGDVISTQHDTLPQAKR
ncbi:(2Fe-2S)-binding protein [Aeromicrobium sp. CTD01-1L150]|uniref:(2Fe-2S)-binding protein n=1 Tax=Aeromicrobium sp. CTD01-1L150 TaxID=3341830 RepID=UPI0035C0EE56